MLRRLVPLVLVVLAASLAPVAPAQARPVGAESVRVIVRTDRMRAGVEQGVYMWAAGQTRYRLQINDTCYPGDLCIVVDDTRWAGDWYTAGGVAYGSESWWDHRGRCQIRVPLVLTRPQLLDQFAGADTGGVPVDVWVQGGVTAHEIGHCFGLSDTGGGTGVMGDPPAGAVSAAEAEAVWAAR